MQSMFRAGRVSDIHPRPVIYILSQEYTIEHQEFFAAATNVQRERLPSAYRTTDVALPNPAFSRSSTSGDGDQSITESSEAEAATVMALLEGALLIAKGYRIQDFSTWQPKCFLNHNGPGKLWIFDHSTNSSKTQQ